MNRKMKLDKLDKKIFTSLYKGSRKSLSKLSNEIGISKENINYRIKKFEKNELIEYIPFVNLSKLGYEYFFIKINIDPTAKKYSEYLNKLMQDKKILFLAEEEILRKNDYNLFIIEYGKNYRMIDDKYLEAENNKLINNSKISLVKGFGFNYLDIYSEDTNYDRYFPIGSELKEELSEYEIDLILELLNDGKIQINQLANKLTKSPITIRNTIKKLTDDAVIKNFVISMKYDKLEGNFVALNYDAEKRNVSKEAREILAKYFYEVFGVFSHFTKDRMIFGRVKDNAELNKALSEINKLDGFKLKNIYQNKKIIKNKVF